jgi:YVTN family beta-propeller protein
MTGFFFVASGPYGAHAEQHNPAKATTFGYVANAEGSTISVIATNNNTVVATIPVGAIPIGVAATPDGTRAYVTNQNSDTVSVIDTASNKVVATIPVGQLPDGVAISSDENPPSEHDDRRRQPLAYVTNDRDNTVSVIDTASNKVVATIPVGQSPTAVAVTRDGAHAYVTNLTDGTVSVIDTDSNTVIATITVASPLSDWPSRRMGPTVWSHRNPHRRGQGVFGICRKVSYAERALLQPKRI